MTLESRFNQAVVGWIEHCSTPQVRFSPVPSDLTDCPAYRELVAMDTAALPLIRELFDKDSKFYLLDKTSNSLVVPKKVAQKPDFFDAMMKFQYGEAEESDAGFEEMGRIAGADQRDDAFISIKALGISMLVQEIMGERFQIPEEMRGRIKEMMEYTKNWLDENMPRYV